MRTREPEYRAYLLRTWAPSSGSGRHFVVQDIATNQTWAFQSLAGLCGWLDDAVGSDVSEADTAARPGEIVLDGRSG